MWAASTSVTGWRASRPFSIRMPKSGNSGMFSSARIGRSPSGTQEMVETVTAKPASTGACVPTWLAEV